MRLFLTVCRGSLTGRCVFCPTTVAEKTPKPCFPVSAIRRFLICRPHSYSEDGLLPSFFVVFCKIRPQNLFYDCKPGFYLAALTPMFALYVSVQIRQSADFCAAGKTVLTLFAFPGANTPKRTFFCVRRGLFVMLNAKTRENILIYHECNLI